MPDFDFEGQRLAYTVRGDGRRPCVLLHGQLLSQRMQERLALALSDQGNTVITMDLLGHGLSDRPPEMWRYSMTQFAEQVIALLDHLGIKEAAIAGTSLGANVALEVGALAPERTRALVVEMPVLENGVLAAVLIFTPLLAGFEFLAPLVRATGALARRVPRCGLPFIVDVALDTMRQDHVASSALLQGLVFGRTAPNRELRRKMRMPTLVVGHPRDPLHPFSDADMLVREMPNARLLQAESILELRVRPERLTQAIAAFLDESWQRPTARPRRPARRGARRLSPEPA